jgi:small subunit ribosomal protein S1
MSNRPSSGFTRPHESDEAIDNALSAATSAPKRAGEVSLKRQWDDELEKELLEALEGFDVEALEVPRKGRTRAADRAHAPQEGRGQEERQGVQQAKVVGVRSDVIFLDLGAKSEGIVPLEQFGENVPAVGEMIEVVFDRYDREEGLLVMSVKGAAVEASWENLRKGLVVDARVTKVNKGGVDVEVDGIRGFMPISQIDMNRVEDAATFLNQKLRVMVTDVNVREKNLVVSRKELLLKEREEMREKTWAELEEGQVRKGTVRSLKDFGAFVDLGGVDGLLHISDMSWVRKQDVADVVRPGQELEVKVLKIDQDTKKVSLGLKQLIASPWDTADQRYDRGQVVKGKVTKLMDFGAFVELEPGVEGLIHISELSPKRVMRVRDVVQPEQEIEVKILEIDTDAKRMSLSLKATQLEPPSAPEDEDDAEEVPVVKPVRKVPLKGGLGDSDPNPFGSPPK